MSNRRIAEHIAGEFFSQGTPEYSRLRDRIERALNAKELDI